LRGAFWIADQKPAHRHVVAQNGSDVNAGIHKCGVRVEQRLGRSEITAAVPPGKRHARGFDEGR
jgi:hypothetical protein